jgi:hypothetical protein
MYKIDELLQKTDQEIQRLKESVKNLSDMNQKLNDLLKGTTKPKHNIYFVVGKNCSITIFPFYPDQIFWNKEDACFRCDNDTTIEEIKVFVYHRTMSEKQFEQVW